MKKEKLDNIDKLLIDYMDMETVDYAYLITGNWGCGKSYYCNNILQELLREFCYSKETKYVVNLSLFGRKDLGNVFTEITIKVIGMEKGYSLIDRFNLEEAASVAGDASNKSWVSSLFSYFGKIVNKNLPDIVQGFEKLDLKKQVLIVFDDLERCEEKDLKYLIGRIQTEFIDNGYHVLFVANENEIKWKDFFTWKEKFIRTTISFSKTPSSILSLLLEKRTDGPIKELYSFDKSKFLSLINILSKINNIRTWMFAFDLYDKIINEARSLDSNPYLLNLFLIIVVTCYYNNTNRSLLDTVSVLLNDKTEQTLGRAVQADFKLSCEELPGLYGREFTLDSRLHSPGYVFVRMNSIIELIRDGYLNIHCFNEEFDAYFPWGSEYEIAYSKINEFLCLDEEEFKESVEIMIQGVIQRKYKLYQYINIAVVMDHLEANGYLALVNSEGFKQILIEALDSFDASLIEGDSKYLKQRYDESPEFIRPSIQRIIDEADSFDDKEEVFLKFFQELEDTGFFDSRSVITEVFFEYVEKYRFANKVLSLSGKALKGIDAYVYSFTKYEKCGSYYGKRIPSMKYLNTEIGNYLANTSDRSKHFYDLKYFNGMLSVAIKKLES